MWWFCLVTEPCIFGEPTFEGDSQFSAATTFKTYWVPRISHGIPFSRIDPQLNPIKYLIENPHLYTVNGISWGMDSRRYWWTTYESTWTSSWVISHFLVQYCMKYPNHYGPIAIVQWYSSAQVHIGHISHISFNPWFVPCPSPRTIFGNGEQVRAFSYIDDVAPIIARGPLKLRARNEIFNVGADVPYSATWRLLAAWAVGFLWCGKKWFVILIPWVANEYFFERNEWVHWHPLSRNGVTLVGPRSIEIGQPFDESIGTLCGEAGRILECWRDLAGRFDCWMSDFWDMNTKRTFASLMASWSMICSNKVEPARWLS